MPVFIPEKWYSEIQTAGRSRLLPARTDIYMQGDPASCMYLVVSGRVRVFVLSSEGKEQTIEILEAGRIFGDSSFLSGVSRSVTIQTVVETEVISFYTEDLIRMCHRSEELMLLIFQHMAETCNYLTHQLTRQAHYSSRQKVGDFLLCESENRSQVFLPYTHEEIADSVALNRVTVSRIMKQMEKEGIIECGYRCVRVKDRSALERMLPQK